VGECKPLVLGRLREAGLITYPSPLGRRLLEELPEVLAAEVLGRLDPVDRTMLAGVGRPWRGAVLASGLPRALGVLPPQRGSGRKPGASLHPRKRLSPPAGSGGRLKLAEFCTSVDRLAWAKANGCPWGLSNPDTWMDDNPCAVAAGGGHLEVLKWAREQGCPWNHQTFLYAALGGHLEVMKWALDNRCPWQDNRYVLENAARGGHLEVLKWAMEHGCEWEDGSMCEYAALGGHLELLKWAREHGCDWDEWTCPCAAQAPGGVAVGAGERLPVERMDMFVVAQEGQLELLKWAREHGCPWDAATRDLAATKGYSDNLPL